MRILGVDPGLRNTGFGVIEIVDSKPYYVTSGVISTTSTDSLPTRLKIILNGMNSIILDAKPSIAVVEKVFVNNNPQSTLLLGQARGVAMAACVGQDIEVYEYTALQVKQSVVGYGHAEKGQVGKMVQYLLSLTGEPRADAADALAVALAHYHYAKVAKIFNLHVTKKGRLIG